VFLDLLTDSVATTRMLLLLNYRPEYSHGWGSKTYYTQLRLDPLGREEAQELLEALLGKGDGAGVEALTQLILEKTEGNPFFIEEVVQTLVEEGMLTGQRGSYRLEKAPGELHIPATVQGVLAARIDRLPGEEKELLQTLAVVGKEFPLGLALRVSEQPEEGLQRLLSHLQAGEFIYEQPAFPEVEYTFKHALTQEVAYGSVLTERRKELHERTARAMEEVYGNNLEEHYNELAHHYGRTDNTEKAVQYLHLAGQQAVERSAYGDAISQLTRALELIKTLPETETRHRQELLVQSTIGPAFMATRGYAGREAEEAYRRARELSERVGETPLLSSVLAGLQQFHFARAEHTKARALAEQFRSRAERQQDSALVLVADALLSEELFWTGQLIQAREYVEECISLYDPGQYRSYAFLYALDPMVTSFCYAAWLLIFLGYPDQALARSRQALNLSQELSHPASRTFALSYVSGTERARGNLRASQERAEAAIALATEQGFPDWLAMGTLLRSEALAAQGQLEEAITQGSLVIDALRATGVRLGMPWNLGWLAEAHTNAGRPEKGIALVGEALDLVNETGERVSESNLYRVKGNSLLALSQDDEA
jgi:predicted ATPase